MSLIRGLNRFFNHDAAGGVLHQENGRDAIALDSEAVEIADLLTGEDQDFIMGLAVAVAGAAPTRLAMVMAAAGMRARAAGVFTRTGVVGVGMRLWVGRAFVSE